MSKLLGISVSEDFFVMTIYRLFENIFTGKVNWFDFSIGFSTMILTPFFIHVSTFVPQIWEYGNFSGRKLIFTL